MNILSLFDGMSCGYIAFKENNIKIDKYYAYEIEEDAIKTSQYNFPDIVHCGDVFKADFNQYKGKIDFLVGGSPCTYWSIAQKPGKREVINEGFGWDLFCQYTRALREVKPKYFIYENNYSMDSKIRESIDEAFDFDAVHINSALVSAQNRQRLYWVGIRNDTTGEYDKVRVCQPEDKKIFLKDIIESGFDFSKGGKSFCLTTGIGRADFKNTLERSQREMIAEKVNTSTICDKVGVWPTNSELSDNQSNRIYWEGGKSATVDTGNHGIYATRFVGSFPQTNKITGECKQNKRQSSAIYDEGGKSSTIDTRSGSAGYISMKVSEATQDGYTDIQIGECVDLAQENSKTRRGRKMGGESNCLTTSPAFYQYIGTVKHPIYEVKNGLISIKGKEYPIKLKDGFYIIRHLTVLECMRLQTVPEWYKFDCVSKTAAYKMLGNGWTVDVIRHLINSCLKGETLPKYNQMNLFDML